MTSFMIIVVIALFIVLVGFTWYRAEAYDGMEKVIICVSGILISWVLTSIIFNLSSKGIEYISIEVEQEIRKILVLVFTPVNGIIYMPYVTKLMSKYKFDEIKSEEIVKKVSILIVVFIVICILEIMYLKNIQLGIINIANQS